MPKIPDPFVLHLVVIAALQFVANATDDISDHVSLLQLPPGKLTFHANRTPASSARQESLCIRGRHVPELYVLGAMKCGTSSLYLDLARYVPSNAVGKPGDKELQFFDRRRNFCHEGPSLFHDWLQIHPTCPPPGVQRMIGDYSPKNLYLVPSLPNPNNDVCLPSVLRQFYQEDSSRLRFVVMIREPLHRLQSFWYFVELRFNNRPVKLIQPGEFESYVNATLDMISSKIFLERDVWPGMYGRHLEGWMRFFPAKQFVVIPYRYYFDRKLKVLNLLSARLGVDLPPPKNETHQLPTYHPPLTEEVSKPVIDAWDQAMGFETDFLMRVLANESLHDLLLPTYYGALGSEKSIRDWVTDGWM